MKGGQATALFVFPDMPEVAADVPAAALHWAHGIRMRSPVYPWAILAIRRAFARRRPSFCSGTPTSGGPTRFQACTQSQMRTPLLQWLSVDKPYPCGYTLPHG